MSILAIILFCIGAVIIVSLGIYAGRLLFLLKAQNQKQGIVRQQRIENMQSSIQTIAFDMVQQQCDLSEGVIRICRLLEALPITPLPDYEKEYPAIHELFHLVKQYPTHEARAAQTKQLRRKQDKERQQYESELESRILKEAESLRVFTA